jgi:hypothetical protein
MASLSSFVLLLYTVYFVLLLDVVACISPSLFVGGFYG